MVCGEGGRGKEGEGGTEKETEGEGGRRRERERDRERERETCLDLIDWIMWGQFGSANMSRETYISPAISLEYVSRDIPSGALGRNPLTTINVL